MFWTLLALSLAGLLAVTPAAAQFSVEVGGTGQALNQFDPFVSSYNTTYAGALGGARLNGLDRLAGGFGALRFGGAVGPAWFSLGVTYARLGTSARVETADGSARDFMLATREMELELALGARYVRGIATVYGGRKTRLLTSFTDAKGYSDHGDPSICRRSSTGYCLSGDYRDDENPGFRVGLGAHLPLGRTKFGVSAAALYPIYVFKGSDPVYYDPDDLDKPGLRYKYFDVYNERDRCLYSGPPAECVRQFPRSLDASAATSADNYIPGALRGIVWRVGLTYMPHPFER